MPMTVFFCLVITVAIISMACAGSPGVSKKRADLVFKNGAVYTVNPKQPWAQSVAVREGKIVAVGSDEEVSAWIGTDTKVVDLGGRMLLPGFGDAHLHPYSAGKSCNIYGATKEETLAKVRQCAEDQKDLKWVIGFGWDGSVFDNFSPNKSPLDKIIPNKPAIFYEMNGHDAWANSRAFEIAGIDKNTPDPKRGIMQRDPKTGEPTGALNEYAAEPVIRKTPMYSDEELLKGLNGFLEKARRVGITSFAAMPSPPWVLPIAPNMADRQALDTWMKLEEQGALTARVNVVLAADLDAGADADVAKMTALRDEYRKKLAGSNKLEVKTVKIFGDGLIETDTAALSAPYSNRPDWSGKGNLSDDEMKEWVAAVDKEGFQLHIHSIGDATIHNVLDAVEYTRETNGIRDARHQIAHNELIDPEDIGRFNELDVIAQFSPAWAQWTHYEEATVAPKLGDRVNWLYSINSIKESGGRLAFACDCTGFDVPGDRLTPLDSIEMAITRRPANPTYDPSAKTFLPEQSVDLDTAIAARTIGVAYANFQDDVIGSIELGKYADLIVLDRNLFEIPVDDIHNAKVLLTFFEGKPVYQDESWNL